MRLLRQAAVVPPLPERVHRLPRREIDGEGTPLDPVLHHVGNRVAHRPQVMHHRAAHRDRQLPHDLPCPRLQHRPLLVGQVRRVARHAVMAPAARRHAVQAGVPGRGKVNRHEDPWQELAGYLSVTRGLFVSYGNTPHSDQIYTITPHLADLDLYLQALRAQTSSSRSGTPIAGTHPAHGRPTPSQSNWNATPSTPTSTPNYAHNLKPSPKSKSGSESDLSPDTIRTATDQPPSMPPTS